MFHARSLWPLSPEDRQQGRPAISVDRGVLGRIGMGRGVADHRPLLSLLENYYCWLSPEPVASRGSARGSAGRVEHGGWVVIGLIYSVTEGPVVSVLRGGQFPAGRCFDS